MRKEAHRIKLRERNALHRATTAVVKKHNNLAIEALQIGNMTASAKGTEDDPGKNVKQKAGLNRAILEQQWGAFGDQLKYKAEAAGGGLVKVPAAYTTQTCNKCGHRQKMPLNTRTYECSNCGAVEDRDVNAAKNILHRGT